MSAKISYEFYDKKNIYNDGKIEKDLFDFYKGTKNIDRLKDDVFYLTTEIRENIVSWYPFKKDCKILEIGGGLGTVTGKLCDFASKVVSVEASKQRAEVINERHKDRENLEIYVSNINDFKTKEKFDYIVLIGVFEYSRIFFDMEKPFEYFLEVLKKFLNKDGKIIVAIENRYGIKYWAGNNEDHLGIPYAGIIGYDSTGVQTFGKKEITDIIIKSGMKSYKFYYAFPDYKMPQLIFTDNYKLGKYELLSIPIYNFNLYEKYCFNPRQILPGLQDNENLGFFANSFVIEMSPFKTDMSDVAYAKFQPIRNKEFSTITIIKDDKTVVKLPNSVEAIEHLKQIDKIHSEIKNNGLNVNNVKYTNNELKIQFEKGESFEDILIKYLNDEKVFVGKVKDFANFVKMFCENRIFNNYMVEDLENVYLNKTLILKKGLLDFNFGNVFVNKDKYVLIDQEWITDYDIPFDYVIYFAIKIFFEKNNIKCNLENKLYNLYKIDEEKKKIFDNMSRKFFDEIKKVNNEMNFIKLLEHKNIIINSKEKELTDELEFYRNLLDKTKEGYENEIKRMNDLLSKTNQDYAELENIYKREVNGKLINKIKRKLKKQDLR